MVVAVSCVVVAGGRGVFGSDVAGIVRGMNARTWGGCLWDTWNGSIAASYSHLATLPNITYG